MADTVLVFTMEPVLETREVDFSLWPAAPADSFGYLPLTGRLTPDEVGLAVMLIAYCNEYDVDDEEAPPRPVDPIGLFLYGLVTREYVFVPGGLRVVDTSTGLTLTPGCCTGVEDWRNWFLVFDGDSFVGGHDPADAAERHGDVVRLTLDADKADSLFFDVPVDQLRELLTQAERDLVDFHALATDWLRRQLPEQADAVSAALHRALDLR
jgi:hypothetical protein